MVAATAMLRVNGTMLAVARVRSARRVTLTRGWTTLSRSTWRPFRRSSIPILDFHDFHSNPLTRPTPLPPPLFPYISSHYARLRSSRRRRWSPPSLHPSIHPTHHLPFVSSSPFDPTPSRETERERERQTSSSSFLFPRTSETIAPLLSLSTHSRSLCKLIASSLALAAHCFPQLPLSPSPLSLLSSPPLPFAPPFLRIFHETTREARRVETEREISRPEYKPGRTTLSPGCFGIDAGHTLLLPA